MKIPGSLAVASAPGTTQQLDRALERLDQIGLLPGEAAFVVRRTAEMTVSRGAGIDRAVEVKMAANAARRQVHGLRHCFLELVLRHLSGAVRIDIDRQRPRHANRVSKLQRAA